MPPSLAYQWAFDFCAAWSARLPGPVSVVAGPLTSHEELLQRLEGKLSSVPDHTVQSAANSGACALVIWLEPEWNSAARPLLPPEGIGAAGHVIVVTANWCRQMLSEWQSPAATSRRHPLPAARVVSLLEREGLGLRSRIGMPGPAALVFGFSGGLASRARRPDVADRFYARMRQSFLIQGRLAAYTPLSVMLFQRAGQTGGALS